MYEKLYYYIRKNNKEISNVIFILSNINNEKICTILSLNTDIEYRNKGYATKLLYYVINYCKLNDYKTLYLDDCSDNFNKINNIYLNIGFNYINNGSPEMVLFLS